MKRKATRRPKKPLAEASQTDAACSSPSPPKKNQGSGSSKKRKAGDESLSSALKDLHLEHSFQPDEATQFACSLLRWYDASKRDLPWRQLSSKLSPEDKAYSVLVSEVMLQQTQVVTVRSYYEKWMARWPTFSHLAKAPLEEVNELWAGMGYYSRARRLLEAAQKVDNDLNGKVPLTSSDLQEKLPGVGRYTAGAVASIAFGEKCPAVDGNVIRVLARMRCIGADSTSKIAMDHIWKIADTIVPSDRPGDFNQAMMDLGATICTPKKPVCNECPVADLCLANKRFNAKQVMDIEEVPCDLCCPEPLDSSMGVTNYPRKAKKAPPRSEVSLVCVIYSVDSEGKTQLLLSQRPQGGLLAGLWEFPSLALSSPETEDTPKERQSLLKDLLEDQWGLSKKDLCQELRRVSVVLHIFSHIRQQYVVYAAQVSDSSAVQNKKDAVIRWIDKDDLDGTAISTAMKKVFQAFDSADENAQTGPATKKARKSTPADPKSKKLTDFFKVTQKEKL